VERVVAFVDTADIRSLEWQSCLC